MIIAVVYATFADAKRKPEKLQACTGFEPLTSAIPVQSSTNKLTSDTSLHIFPLFFFVCLFVCMFFHSDNKRALLIAINRKRSSAEPRKIRNRSIEY